MTHDDVITTSDDDDDKQQQITLINMMGIEDHLSLQYLKENLSNILIILCQGGYFSIGYYEKNINIAHKCFHRVISKKSPNKNNMKNKSNKVYSFNENKHKEEIGNTLHEWKEWVHRAKVIFYHAPGTKKGLLCPKEAYHYR